MTLQWLISLVVLPALFGAAVALGEPWFRSRSIPTRFLWAGAMVASLVWGTVAALSPHVAGAVSGTVAHLPPVVIDATGALTVAAAPLSESVHRSAPVLIIAVAACGLFGLVRLATGWRQLRRERATWGRHTVDGCDVLVSHDRGPAVVGLVDPQIVLPEWMVSADAATRRIVLRHESEHKLANDVATLLAARVLLATVPWNPGLRWMASRIALAIEHDCDIRVLRSGVSRSDYEEALLAVAYRIGPPRLAPSLSENPCHLERRITAMRMLNRRRSALRPLAGSAIALAAMYAVFILPVTPDAVAQVLPAIASLSVPPDRATSVSTVPPAATRTADAAGRRASGAPTVAVVRDTVYFEYQVDQQVAVDSMTAPRYPAAQRMANVESEVIAQFVVDTMGRIEPASLRVLRTNHEDFTAAVRDALQAARFKPAMKGGQKVRQVVQMPFMFRLNR